MAEGGVGGGSLAPSAAVRRTPCATPCPSDSPSCLSVARYACVGLQVELVSGVVTPWVGPRSHVPSQSPLSFPSHSLLSCPSHSLPEPLPPLCTPALQVELVRGVVMPMVGYGTAGLTDLTADAVFTAIRVGYRLVDSAGVSGWLQGFVAAAAACLPWLGSGHLLRAACCVLRALCGGVAPGRVGRGRAAAALAVAGTSAAGGLLRECGR